MFGAALLVVVLLTGCGDLNERNDASAQLPASDVNPTPRDRIVNGGTLRWPLPEFPSQWNFNHVNGTKGAVEHVIQGVLPYLMRPDEKSVPHPVPEYLESAALKRTKHGQTDTNKLNPRARWSDGRPLGYADFAAQARALSGRDTRYEVSTVSGYRLIRHVEQGDRPGEVEVTFAQTYADWRSLFSPLYPAAAYSSPRAFNTDWMNRLPITAGPFKVQRLDRTGKTVTLARDPSWWGPPAKLDRIVYRAMDTSAIPGAFANHEIDLMDIGLDAGAMRRVQDVPNTEVRRAGGPDWRHFTFNAAGPVLSDVRVRRAVMLGIDRRVIARSDLTGLGVPVSKREGELTRALLARIGVRLDIKPIPADDALDTYVTQGNFDIVPFSWLGTSFPVSPMRAVYARPHDGRVQQNYSRTGTAAIDTAMDQAIAEIDPANIHALVNRADRLIWRQASVLPLYQRPQLVAARADLANLGAGGFLEPAYQNIGFTRR
jgi:peptide/nickel transport system substrate-binding protein